MFTIYITAFCLGRSSPHLLLLKSSMDWSFAIVGGPATAYSHTAESMVEQINTLAHHILHQIETIFSPDAKRSVIWITRTSPSPSRPSWRPTSCTATKQTSWWNAFQRAEWPSWLEMQFRKILWGLSLKFQVRLGWSLFKFSVWAKPWSTLVEGDEELYWPYRLATQSIFQLWVDYFLEDLPRGQYGCSSPANSVLHGQA